METSSIGEIKMLCRFFPLKMWTSDPRRFIRIATFDLRCHHHQAKNNWLLSIAAINISFGCLNFFARFQDTGSTWNSSSSTRYKDAKISELFQELQTLLNHLTAKMNQKIEKENELTYFRYYRALLAVKPKILINMNCWGCLTQDPKEWEHQQKLK